MQEAVFMERQPEVRYSPLGNGMADVTICLNERQKTINNGDFGTESNETKMWAYDYHYFREKEEYLDVEAMRENPQEWSDYIPKHEPTVDEKLEEMQMNNDMAIAELSILIAQLMV